MRWPDFFLRFRFGRAYDPDVERTDAMDDIIKAKEARDGTSTKAGKLDKKAHTDMA